MEPKVALPPLLFPSADRTTRRWMTDLKKAKKIRLVGPRLYASVPDADLPDTIRKQWAQIVSHLFPKSVLSYRSAIEFKPSPRHEIFLTGTTNRVVEYPGLKIVFVRGEGPLDGDMPVTGFYCSSRARAFLENFQALSSKSERALTQPELEARLERILQKEGASGLNAIRDRVLQSPLALKAGFRKLDQTIGALLGTIARALPA